MKTPRLQPASRGFTLVEMLVVISIIAILAGLLLAAGGGIRQKAAKQRAKTELQQVALAIETYKLKLGYYPPDNQMNYGLNTLFYELVGCTRINSSQTDSTFTPLDGAPAVSTAVLSAQTVNPQITGIMNSSGAGSSSDDGRTAQSFLKDLKSTQYADAGGLRRLGIKLDGPAMIGSSGVTPIFYNSSSPTNNPNSFDLWVDVIVGSTTNRISNWSAGPQPL